MVLDAIRSLYLRGEGYAAPQWDDHFRGWQRTAALARNAVCKLCTCIPSAVASRPTNQPSHLCPADTGGFVCKPTSPRAWELQTGRRTQRSEAGAAVAANVPFCGLNIVTRRHEDRCVEVIDVTTNGLPLWGGVQLAVDTILVSASRKGDTSTTQSVQPIASRDQVENAPTQSCCASRGGASSCLPSGSLDVGAPRPSSSCDSPPAAGHGRRLPHQLAVDAVFVSPVLSWA